MRNERSDQPINWELCDKYPKTEKPQEVNVIQELQPALGSRFPELAILRNKLAQTPEGLFENFTIATELMLTKGIVPRFQGKLIRDHKDKFNDFLNVYFQA